MPRWAPVVATLGLTWAMGTSAPAAVAGAPAPGRSSAPSRSPAPVPFDAIEWPEGTERLAFENLEGILLVAGRLRGATRDTSGPLILDTGAGYLGLDHALAAHLGLANPEANDDAVRITRRPLQRLELGARQMDQIAPVLTVDGEIVRSATDRPVLGILGQSLFANGALVVDYGASVVALVPDHAPRSPTEPSGTEPRPESGRRRVARASDAARIADSRGSLGPSLTRGARAVPFDLVADGKVLVRARVSDPRPPRRSAPLTLILDTGAAKTALFESALDRHARRHGAWAGARGLVAPTLFGDAPAGLVRVPRFELEAADGAVRCDSLDAAVIESPLEELLSRAAGRAVHGLLGYSFLRRYRVIVDYPNRVLWLAPRAGWNDRPWEYSTVGVQLERRDGDARIAAIVQGSPADEAGVRTGDVLLAVDGGAADSLDIAALARRLEGPPGSTVELVLRRGAREWTLRLARRELL